MDMHFFNPHISKNRIAGRLLLKTARQLANSPPPVLDRFRNALFDEIEGLPLTETAALHLRITASVLCDLYAHGWRIVVNEHGMFVCPPNRDDLGISEHKDEIRKSLLLERDAQLRQSSNRRFVASMEKRRLHNGRFCSILSLLRDGRELAHSLDRARSVTGNERLRILREAIDPYVQLVEPGKRCIYTGLELQDIWRYFRHTWVTPYRSVPGRQLSFLIRDRAAPNHPVIGIASLASSVVQQSRRDEWIGWSEPAFLARMNGDNYRSWPRWVDGQLNELISEVYVADFVKQGLLRRRDLQRPSPEIIARLQRASASAKAMHRRFRQEDLHKSAGQMPGSVNWRRQAQTHLFKSKRAGRLAELLQARLDLIDVGFKRASAASLKAALRTNRGRRAVRTILRLVKARHVGIDMMDISVCGAVAPYGPLLGGKLVALLMASPTVIKAYSSRYALSISVIASSMAGRAVRRRPRLVLLMTTSLYGVASSQYNRLRVPSTFLGTSESLNYLNLEQTAGFGSYHFSNATLESVEVLLARSESGREVNSIFGEGVNPKLRKIRSALHTIGLPANQLLLHGAPRIVYAVPLAKNFRDILIGRASRPHYVIPGGRTGDRKLVEYWFERWLSRRIENDAVIGNVAEHALVFPIRHGGRVVLDASDDRDIGPLFEQAL